MIIVMANNATEQEIEGVIRRIEDEGFKAHLSRGVEKTIIGVIGDERRLKEVALEVLPGVEEVIPILQPYKMASRSFRADRTVIDLGDGIVIGGERIHVMAGPCAVESREQLLTAAEKVKAAGATILRGGAFKPRTSPYSFQGLGEEGLKILAEAREKFGLKIVTEVMDIRTLPLVAAYADIIQIGTRNMQNFDLLKEVGKVNRPVLLKRGLSATIEEWLMAAEYILANGNFNVILCERGIRSFETYTRNTLDLSAVPVVKHLSHLPVVVDPSHGLGRWKFVAPMCRAAIAAGADGLLVEVHPNPAAALCDGAQSLTPENFGAMMDDLRRIAAALGRTL
ncbi:3-deoxy-D-arabinoheptulosonate-7-phosphate synthase [Thermodesulfitimonas autotrophica]|uniref:3-deoxy-D-arabinoheptulosonate-7-phosphate synthase n=1 Tax=Thermodesulfitimonas autotrophica TaxID=1894989 RepID=A0A3N5B0N3_9THEO|nr:3-deoxy-7-phosphoheptulonate synthase [Thermodesulfitimonas autotrophica]RPF43018.1 3-deoxy-D-arabinoheptulosonate-7-phosphate synthase [Thermodesulfitimonas autotrophica]